MDIKIEVPAFTADKGIVYKWENGFEIETKYESGVINIVANKEGLISLANHLLNLAQAEVPVGYHLHFDEYNSLEENSLELIIQKK
jgi:Ni,Fe-hydrogenase III large subunit